ncbi:glycosyltransferase family 2 protein [Flavobacterium sp. RSP49]|uniref:glycosyltransferase family 2 protein n=1 Tax=Flavobacterium sp. RSP49 TaxID=2497487 RepID=UPI00131581C6|nr:glycosyltransferase family A protein [Flavobacterium sp. RSP49]
MIHFSVVIPLFNKETFIENTLKSVLNQTFTDFEVILIDDASTDSGFSIATSLASPKIRTIKHETNRGLSATRNTGIKNAKAKFIAFLDADDIWEINFLEKIFLLTEKYPEAKLFATNYLEIYSNTIALPPKTNIKSEKIIPNFFEASLCQPIYCPSSLCVDKLVFEEIGYYNEAITFGEDVDFNIRANNSFTLAYSHEACVKYIMFSENQITNSTLKNKTITNFDSYERIASENPSLKKYLDFNRYIMAKHYKMENDLTNFYKIKKRINANSKISGLNLKQRLLLNLPSFMLQFLKKVKTFFIKKGIRFTTYD